MKKNQRAVPMLVAAALCWSTSGILIKMVTLPFLAIAGGGLVLGAVTVKSILAALGEPSGDAAGEKEGRSGACEGKADPPACESQ